MENNLWKVGIYTRISRDDDTQAESNSIRNQKILLTDYVQKEENMQIYDYYSDDGYSGTNFNRPDFKRMFQDIQNGKINAIIVKDLSRLGRNYISLGEYMEQIFPLYNLRFISVNDRIDSYKNPDSLNTILVPFKNLLNDEYSRDISMKVKSALNAKRYNGEYVGATAPYGYRKDPKNKNKLILDKKTSPIVKQIFDLASQNYSYAQIAAYLNERGVLNPATYKEISFHQRNKKNTLNTSHTWSSSSVCCILKNPIYCGNLVQCKTKKINYKISKQIKVKEEDQIVVENTHPPIVSKELYEDIQRKKKKTSSFSSKNNSLFRGYLKCYDCNYKMKRINGGLRSDHKTRNNYFYCSTYQNRSKTLCSSHRITEEYLETIITQKIHQKIDAILQKNEKISTYWMEEFKKYKHLTHLNRSLLEDLIDVIYIHDNLDISIAYKYENES